MQTKFTPLSPAISTAAAKKAAGRLIAHLRKRDQRMELPFLMVFGLCE